MAIAFLKYTQKIAKNFTFCFLIIRQLSLTGQNIEYRQFTSANGLLSDKVYNVFADSRGYIWINSEFGTLRYNGETFEKVFSNLPLDESFMFCFYERSDGKIWVSNSKANIFELRNDSAIKVSGFEKTSEDLRKNVAEIVQLVVDEHDNIFIGTKHYSYKFIKQAGGYQTENLISIVDRDSSRLALLQVDGEWVAVMNRTSADEFVGQRLRMQQYFYFQQTGKKVLVTDSAFRLNLRHFRSVNKKLFFTNGDGISVLDAGDSLKIYHLGSTVINFKIDAAKHIWACCINDGVFELDTNGRVIGHYLAGKTVNDVAIDFQNGVWASTSGYGIYRISKQTNKLLAKLNSNYSISFAKKVDGLIVLANTASELKIYKAGKLLNANSSYTLLPSACTLFDNNLIVAYPNKIVQYDAKSEFAVSKVVVAKCTKLLELSVPARDTIVGVWRRGVIKFAKDYAIKSLDFGRRINCSAIRNDTIWLGTENGLYFYPLRFYGTGKRFAIDVIADLVEPMQNKSMARLNNKYITALSFDHTGRMWVGVRSEGLFVKENGAFKKINSPQGEIINHITVENYTVVATNRGAFLMLKDVAGKAYAEWSKLFNGEVQSTIITKSDLYVLTGFGLSAVNISALVNNKNEMHFRISKIFADSTQLLQNAPINISAATRSIKFVFDRITYNTHLPVIIYELNGPVTQKGQVFGNSIVFSRLLPGEYELTAYPDILDRAAKTVNIKFVVFPMWYQTWWAILLFIALIASLIALAIVLIVKRHRRKLEAKNKQEQLLIEYKLIALKAQVNPHFISNCLTAIQNLIAKGESTAANAYVAKFGLLVRRILDYSSVSLITLSEELEVVKLYIQMEEVRFGRAFVFSVDFSSDIDASDVLVPSLLLNPIVENAIWHGLLPLPSNEIATIQIKISKASNLLEISIKDNGVGITEKKVVESARKSYGLEITEQRIKNINFLLQSTAGKVELKSKQTSGDTTRGVEVLIKLPLESKYE